ncbi:MAG: hypothetical protein LBQ15_08855 [Clostridium sp.]|jgi:hypothetical protein|nr:hypothetical protein [Clostridium sp.]
MQPLYTNVRVNNEIELCEISDPDCKQLIEKALLQKRISYCLRWPKPPFFGFSRKKNVCIICVNSHVKEEAEAIVRTICDETGYEARFLMRKTQADYL